MDYLDTTNCSINHVPLKDNTEFELHTSYLSLTDKSSIFIVGETFMKELSGNVSICKDDRKGSKKS